MASAAVHILIVEDDDASRLLLEARLKPLYKVRSATDGLRALECLERHPVDLAIVDALMPGMSGFDLVRHLRSVGSTLPILMLTSLDELDAKRTGFGAGIDDFVSKPVNHEELLWRVQALLRRARIAASNRVSAGALVLDASSYTATLHGVTIDVPRKEFDLLFVLLSCPGTIFTKDQLLDRVWGVHGPDDEATLKTHISRLRSRFASCGEFRIVNVRGLGYRADVTAQGAEEGREGL